MDKYKDKFAKLILLKDKFGTLPEPKDWFQLGFNHTFTISYSQVYVLDYVFVCACML